MLNIRLPDHAKLEHAILKVLLKLYAYIFHYKRLFKIFKGFNTPSYSIDQSKVKSKGSKFIDYLYLFFVLKIMPTNYHLFCFDLKNRKEFKNYIGDKDDPFTAGKLLRLWGDGLMHVWDKYIFNVICKQHDLPVQRQYGIYGNEPQLRSPPDLQEVMRQANIDKVVLKPRLGTFGAGIHFISRDKLSNLKGSQPWEQGEYVIEEPIRQHSEMAIINPHSINSVRIITFLCTDRSVEFFGAMLRTSSSMLAVDNFSLGGIVIGIDMSTGKLKKEGFIDFCCSQEYIQKIQSSDYHTVNKKLVNMRKRKLVEPGRIFDRHPITKTKFYNIQIPYWNEIKKITVKAQKIFDHSKSIGWDIAISSEGPVIIEGNLSWGTAGFQAVNAGFLTKKNRKLFLQYGISFYD